jgi:uncharacterized protein with PIN domain
MGRILKAYETRFRWLLQRVRARRLDQGVRQLVQQARQLSLRERVSEAEGLTRVHERLASQPRYRAANQLAAPDIIFCDAGLGGLARWLRAAGYEVFWEASVDDDELLRQARACRATILTTDSMLMERRVLRERVIPSLWLPPTLSIDEQLRLVFREFNLAARAPRCMTCGGELLPADKEANRDRIPPKTYRWLDQYFTCGRCGRLFWHGTHWRRIAEALGTLGAVPRPELDADRGGRR